MNDMNKKILIGSIIAVAILVLVSFPITISEKVNPEIKPLDNGYFEIITYIDGYCENLDFKGILIKRHMEIWVSGSGLRIEAHTLNPSEPVYYANPSYLYVPVFIGWMWMVSADCYTIHGKAYGNIYCE